MYNNVRVRFNRIPSIHAAGRAYMRCTMLEYDDFFHLYYNLTKKKKTIIQCQTQTNVCDSTNSPKKKKNKYHL